MTIHSEERGLPSLRPSVKPPPKRPFKPAALAGSGSVTGRFSRDTAPAVRQQERSSDEAGGVQKPRRLSSSSSNEPNDLSPDLPPAPLGPTSAYNAVSSSLLDVDCLVAAPPAQVLDEEASYEPSLPSSPPEIPAAPPAQVLDEQASYESSLPSSPPEIPAATTLAGTSRGEARIHGHSNAIPLRATVPPPMYHGPRAPPAPSHRGNPFRQQPQQARPSSVPFNRAPMEDDPFVDSPSVADKNPFRHVRRKIDETRRFVKEVTSLFEQSAAEEKTRPKRSFRSNANDPTRGADTGRSHGPRRPSSIRNGSRDRSSLRRAESDRSESSRVPERATHLASARSSNISMHESQGVSAGPDPSPADAGLNVSRGTDADELVFGQRYARPQNGEVVVSNTRIVAEPAASGDHECVICADSKPASEFPAAAVTVACKHTPGACLDCVQTSIRVDLDSKIWTEIRCPECREHLEYVDIQKYADERTFSRYEELALRSAMSEATNFMWCALGCGSGQIHESGTQHPIVICLHCERRSCFRHSVAWHEGLSCDDYDRLLADPENYRSRLESEAPADVHRRRQIDADRAVAQGLVAGEQAARRRRAANRDEREARRRAAKAVEVARRIAARRKREEEKSATTIRMTTKPCPGCGWAIEKNRGCSHMKCLRCTYEFCWGCGVPWYKGHSYKCKGAEGSEAS